jgi:exonuclease SbcC
MAERTALERELTSLREELSSQRTLLDEREAILANLGAEALPPVRQRDRDDPAAEMKALEERADALSTVSDELSSGARQKLNEMDRRLLKFAESADLATEGMDATQAVDALETAARDRRRTADQSAARVTSLRTRLDTKREMLTEVENERRRMHLYKKVGNELQQNRFIAFLLDESFRDLALRASNELEKISGGRYSLGADDGSFAVIDHVNADERRSVVTLSGGETFLASLALALALAQGITDIAGHSAATRLESMFIDEGFGTLDPTALDLAVEALERLHEGERMVGVITHVPALAERIPGGIAVEQKGGTSTVEMR